MKFDWIKPEKSALEDITLYVGSEGFQIMQKQCKTPAAAFKKLNIR